MLNQTKLMVIFIIGCVLLLVGGILYASEKKNYSPELKKKSQHEKDLKTYIIIMSVGGGIIGLELLYIYVPKIVAYRKNKV